MKTLRPKSAKDIIDLITYFNFCHDASLKRICFLKHRELDENDGSLIYPFQNVEEFVNCDIEIELILNSYKNAKKNQFVRFEFKQAKSFAFFQTENFDYSDIYKLKFKADENAYLNFTFYSTKKKMKFLSISCKELICKEK